MTHILLASLLILPVWILLVESFRATPKPAKPLPTETRGLFERHPAGVMLGLFGGLILLAVWFGG